MFKRLMCVGVVLAAQAMIPTGVWAEDRFALVIGNGDYDAVPALPNPVKDAEAVSDLLEEANFKVETADNLGQEDLRKKVRDFVEGLADESEGSVALIYFAGHGLQVDGQNYLVPVDAQIEVEADVPLEAVRLAEIMSELDTTPSKVRIVILDACRNNPFKEISERTGRGLAIVNAPAGSMVAYSTSPGATAEDGSGNNSPFTAALVKAAKEPGAPIATVLQNVRLAVHEETKGRQTPWEVTALTHQFVFFPGGDSETGEVIVPEPEKTEQGWREELEGMSPEQAYDVVIRQDNVIVYQVFIALFPDASLTRGLRGLFDRRLEMLAWFDAVRLNSNAAYLAFLDKYPDSDLAPTARKLAKRALEAARFINGSPGALGIEPDVRTVVKEVEVPGEPEIREVVKEVKVPVEVIKEVEIPVVKRVVREVKVPVRVVREVEVPVRVVREVEVPVITVVRVPIHRDCPNCERPICPTIAPEPCPPCDCRGAGGGRPDGGHAGGGDSNNQGANCKPPFTGEFCVPNKGQAGGGKHDRDHGGGKHDRDHGKGGKKAHGDGKGGQKAHGGGRKGDHKASGKKAPKKRAAPKKAPKKRAAPKKASKKRAAPKKASKKRAAPKKASKRRAAPKKASKKRAAPKKRAPPKKKPKKKKKKNKKQR